MSLRDAFWSKAEPWNSVRSWTIPRLLRVFHCALMCTLRVSTTGVHRFDYEASVRSSPDAPHNRFFVLWHDHTFVLLHLFRRCDIHVMMSTSRAGQIQAAFWRLYGWPTIWGSTKKRQGIVALRNTLRHIQDGGVVGFTPDGPKGPRHHVHPGAVYLASKAPAAIIPISVVASRAWHMPTWDKYLLPKPFARVHVHMGPPVHVPPKLSREDTEVWQKRVEAALVEAERVANVELAARLGAKARVEKGETGSAGVSLTSSQL